MARFSAQTYRPTPVADPFAEVPFGRGERNTIDMGPRDKSARALLSLRSEPNPRDQTLSPLAQDWWRRLSPELQPHELCLRYPRVANRLALCWDDADLTEQLFASLLLDKRGGRKGFPRDVLEELLKLRKLIALRREASKTSPAGPISPTITGTSPPSSPALR